MGGGGHSMHDQLQVPPPPMSGDITALYFIVIRTHCPTLKPRPQAPSFFVIITDTLYYNAVNGGNKERTRLTLKYS